MLPRVRMCLRAGATHCLGRGGLLLLGEHETAPEPGRKRPALVRAWFRILAANLCRRIATTASTSNWQASIRNFSSFSAQLAGCLPSWLPWHRRGSGRRDLRRGR